MSRTRPGAAGRLFDLLFPPACVACGTTVESGAEPLCGLCRHRLPSLAPPRCPRCGATRVLDMPAPDRCLECAGWPPGLPRASAPFRMEGRASRVVHALKYEGARALADAMGEEMAPVARELAGGRPAVLVPVPLAPGRRRERGFNQADDLARGLARATGGEVRRPLRRLPGGRRQARLGLRARRRNAAGRFRPAEGARAPDAPVLVVDDVLTTGATAAACARTLSRLGAEVLGAVTFARALQRLETGRGRVRR